MTLTEWVEAEGHGALSKLQRDTGLAYTTVFHAAKEGVKTIDVARKIVAATGGRVTLEELIGTSGDEAAE